MLAILYRAEELKIINKNTFDNMYLLFKNKGWKHKNQEDNILQKLHIFLINSSFMHLQKIALENLRRLSC